MTKTLLIAADHAGVELKALLKADAEAAGWSVTDLGPQTDDRVDYPVFAEKLCTTLLAGAAQMGVLICGSGIGMSIAANRFKGIRAALCHDVTTAQLARQHNNANVLCLGARTTGVSESRDCLKVFLETAFEGGRHQQRIELMG